MGKLTIIFASLLVALTVTTGCSSSPGEKAVRDYVKNQGGYVVKIENNGTFEEMGQVADVYIVKVKANGSDVAQTFRFYVDSQSHEILNFDPLNAYLE